MTTLATTKQVIDEWRTAKINSNTPIPKKIWSMVEQLLLVHTKSEIRKALGITSGQIRSHCVVNLPIGNQAAQSAIRAVNNFVEATPPPLNIGMAELTIKGDSKTLQLRLPATALSEVLPILGAFL